VSTLCSEKQQGTSIPSVQKLDILCFRWRHADIIFSCF